jgi:hypothetical protein
MQIDSADFNTGDLERESGFQLHEDYALAFPRSILRQPKPKLIHWLKSD